MPHTELVIKANKLNFLKRIIDRATNCNKTAAFILKIENIENFLKYKNSVRFLHPLPKFYEQLLDMWYSIHNTEPTTINDILQENIWYNARILIGDKPVFNKAWFQAGIEHIQDLCEGNSLMTKDMLSQKYQITCDFFFYNGLKEALPSTWLEKIHAANNVHQIILESDKLLSLMFKNKQMDLQQVKCSQLYWADVLKIVERPTCYCKWESEYYYATFDWELINVIPYESTAETYLQSLQFRIIHRYFPCRYNLHLWNIVGDNKCEFCNDADTLSHCFTECDSVVQFWKFLK